MFGVHTCATFKGAHRRRHKPRRRSFSFLYAAHRVTLALAPNVSDILALVSMTMGGYCRFGKEDKMSSEQRRKVIIRNAARRSARPSVALENRNVPSGHVRSRGAERFLSKRRKREQ